MRICAVHVGLLALFVPCLVLAQGRQTKVYYDDSFALGSQKLVRTQTDYFEILTTPAPEDPDADLLRYWGPKLDDFFERVCANLNLSEPEIYKYLLYPDYFSQIEKLVIEGRLHADYFDYVMQRCIQLRNQNSEPFRDPLVFVNASAPPEAGTLDDLLHSDLKQRWQERSIHVSADTVFVWLPGSDDRAYQRCVLYRTLSDFLATPIGPPLPEGVLGFVPRHDPQMPIVIYASLGEHRLQRTAQHEIAHAVIENIAKYLRGLAVTRLQNMKPDSMEVSTWTRSSGGFSAITHENFAEYLAFPHGQMEPALRSALIEMVAENRLDGLAAISVGARTVASSYIEGPARLFYLAETYGLEMPKKLLVGYYTHSKGFLDHLEDLTGHNLETLEQLYRRWLRESLWDEYLATDIPDTIGSVLANGLSGVRRDGQTLVQRAHEGRQEVVMITPRKGRRRPLQQTITRDLDGIERLPLFTSADLRSGWVVTAVRQLHKESLLIWNSEKGSRIRHLDDLGEVREVRDPRLSPSATAVVFRVVDRSGRNAIAYLNLENDSAHLLIPYQWAEVAYPSFAESDQKILYSSTKTQEHKADVFLLDLTTNEICNLTATPHCSELEPILVHGHLVCFSDATGVPVPVEVMPDGTRRELMHLPFPVSRLQHGDSTLTLVANSLRHQQLPAARAVWGFPLEKLGLQKTQPEPEHWDIAHTTRHPHFFYPAGLWRLPLDAELTEIRRLEDETPTSLATTNASHLSRSVARVRTAVVQGRTQETPASGDGPRRSGQDAPASEGEIRVAANKATDGSLLPSSLFDPRSFPVSHESAGLVISPYKQKWQMMPLGINVHGSNTRARGISFMGFDTEFHDQTVLAAAGQNGDFDRFGMLQYRNQASRTHWQVSGFHRSIVRSRYEADSTLAVSRNESETGFLLGAQYHKSLVTRLGAGLSLTRRSDAKGAIVAREEESAPLQTNAPLMGLQFPGLHPRTWSFSLAGLSELSVLTDHSDIAMARWIEAERMASNQAKSEFLPTQEYVRSNLSLGLNLSRDTRVWSDVRGPNSGSLLILSVSSGFNAPGSHLHLNSAQEDSVRDGVAAGLDRVGSSLLFLTHRRAHFVDLAFRLRALHNDGPQALLYGLGGLYSVSGFSSGHIRSERIAYTNLEARVQIWDYSSIRFPIRSLVFPAADGFLFVDGGMADGASPIYSYGIGWRLRLGFLAYEWRHPLRSGLRNQNGLTFLW